MVAIIVLAFTILFVENKLKHVHFLFSPYAIVTILREWWNWIWEEKVSKGFVVRMIHVEGECTLLVEEEIKEEKKKTDVPI